MIVTVSDLRERPEFFEVMVDRIWDAWWKSRGIARAALANRAKDTLTAGPIPTAFIAHQDHRFLGTASLIACDLDERPELTPWVAAVWTEPQARNQGVARRLIAQTRDLAFRLGHDPVYLCARSAMRSYYQQRGWRAIEHDVGEQRLTVFASEASRRHVV